MATHRVASSFDVLSLSAVRRRWLFRLPKTLDFGRVQAVVHSREFTYRALTLYATFPIFASQVTRKLVKTGRTGKIYLRYRLTLSINLKLNVNLTPDKGDKRIT